MPQQYSSLVLIVLMVVAFYLLIIRPQKKRQQALQKTMRALEPGTRVLLGSGLFGTVVSVGEKQATLEISPGTHLTVLKQAIVRIVTDADEDLLGGDDEDELESGFAASTGSEIDYRRPGTDVTRGTAPEPVAPVVEPDRPVADQGGTSTEDDRNNLR